MAARPSHARLVGLGCGLYTFAIRMLPLELRQHYDREMLLLFRDQLHDALGHRRLWPLLAFCGHIAGDYVATWWLRPEAPQPVAMLDLNTGGRVASGSLDASSNTVSLLLALLGVALLVGGWVEWLIWLHLKATSAGPHFVG